MKPKSQGYYLTSKRMSVVIEVRDDKVVRTPTNLNRFRGKPLRELREWMMKQGGYKESSL